MKKFNIKQIIIDIVFALLGILSASIGLKCFLLPNLFLDGGATGLSLLITRTFSLDFSIILVLVNLPFVFLGYKQMSLQFSLKVMLTIIGLALAVHFIQLPVFTNDKLLISIFGGIFLGAGIGFAVRGGTVIDGTEVLAIYLSKKFNIKIATNILLINIVIFGIAALVVDLETALYSVLTYISASKATDYIINGIEEYLGITIISGENEKIRKAIVEELGYGATIYRGKHGLTNSNNENMDVDIVHTVITRLELNKLQKVIENIDPSAFIINYNVNDTRGGMIKKLGNTK